jgi:hypothetical protein
MSIPMLSSLVYLSAKDVHDIRHKLQLILAANDGQNAPIIVRMVREVNSLLPSNVTFMNSVANER